MNLIYYFIIFSIFGWIIESIYRSVNNRRFVNPGFLKGPYLPIYGFGALLILAGHTLLISHPLPARVLFYFIGLTGMEYAAGVALEKIFYIRLWDYSDQRFNLGRHVCLRFAVYWTLLAVGLDLSLDAVIPPTLLLNEQLYPVSEIFLGIVALAMTIDFLSITKGRIKERNCHLLEDEALRRRFVSIATPILNHSGVIRLKDCNHHFGKTRLDHVLDVAWMAFRITRYLHLDTESTVRGALLHDLFYYDWLREGPNWHGIRHPRIAIQNAQEVTSLSAKEEDIIKKHMWPLTVIPPRYVESWVVIFCDIYCSWRDYLLPLAFYFIGRRQSWINKSTFTFPSYALLESGYLQDERTSGSLMRKRSRGNALNILLIDAQPRTLPFTTFRTLTLPRLAGATPAKHHLRIIDGRVENINIPTSGVDLVGITFTCNNASLAYSIAKKAKENGLMTVAGGTHTTAIPHEVLQHFDAVLIGEAEGEAWEKMLEDAEEGSLDKRYLGAVPPNLDNLTPPRLDLLGSRQYLPVYPVEATRGCPNRCSFCFNRYIHPVYRKRPITHVVADIERADSKNIFFMDDNLTADSEYAKELFAALRPLKKRLYFQMQLNAAEDEELVHLAAQAGCRSIFAGLESINAASLDSVSKSFNRIRRYKDQVSVLDRHGILVIGGLIFGLDGDNRDVFQQTMEFLNKIKICSVAVNLVIPYPGTDFHAQMQDEGRVPDSDYRNYTGYRLVVAPKGMTSEELEEGYEKFVEEFYSVKNVMSRFRNQHRPLRQLPMYAMINLAFRFPRQTRSRGFWG
jgi:uncharacterized protein